MGVSARLKKKIILQIGLLVGKVTANFFESNSNYLLQLSGPGLSGILNARGDATYALDVKSAFKSSSQEVRTWGKIPEDSEREGNAILTGKKPKYLSEEKFDLTSEEISKSDRPHDKVFQEKVREPLNQCLIDSVSLSLVSKAKKEFDGLIFGIINDVNEACAKIPYVNKPGSGQILAQEVSATSAEGRYDHLVASIQEKMTSANKILQNPLTLKAKSSKSVEPCLSMAIRLNDIFVMILAASEKYKLISERYLTDVLNQKTEVMINYILRYSAWKRDVLALYLNHDLKSSVNKSPLTAEIYGLLKYFTQQTWQDMERTHIYITAKLGLNVNSQDVVVNWLVAQVIEITSPLNATKAQTKDEFNEILEKLLHAILNLSFVQGPKYNELVNVKILYNMLNFLVKYQIFPSEKIIKIRNSQYYCQIRAFNQAIAGLTNGLKKIKFEYDEVLTKILSSPKAIAELKDDLVMRHLTDSKQIARSNFFGSEEAREDSEKPDNRVKVIPESKPMSLEESSSSSVAVKPSSSLALHPKESGSTLGGQQVLQRNKGEKKSLNKPPVISTINRITEKNLNDFENIDLFGKGEGTPLVEGNPLVRHKRALEFILFRKLVKRL